ncbi:hypothetical protein LTR64_003914 [Lithohypha guttulata]|uniref:uncharacterized protein n=1 Tax=Lithohypha guttulata TaxID=1690604 RepID=UPI002DDF955E|nr:hypothetical protein LTR51_006952 [Lithohypha guttulata]
MTLEAYYSRHPTKVGVSSGYVNKNADYMTATPYDISFTLLPLVLVSGRSSLFQSMDDLVDTADVETYDLKYVLQHNRKLVEDALESICDTVEAGDEKMFRYSQTKTLHNIISKARRVVDIRLPASLEDRFVTRTLEAPVLSVRREESTISLSNTEPEPQDSASRTSTPTPYQSFDSQSSAASVAPSVVFSEASVATTTTLTATVPESTIPATIKHLQRLLTAFKFITTSYLSSSLSSTLLALLQDHTVSGIDFAPLNEHLDHIAKLRAQAAASSDLASFSRKRGGLEEDEEAELRAEKKRKLEEEEKRKKASTSHGVKQLAKVDVKGMKKMSAFFTPKVKAKG